MSAVVCDVLDAGVDQLRVHRDLLRRVVRNDTTYRRFDVKSVSYSPMADGPVALRPLDQARARRRPAARPVAHRHRVRRRARAARRDARGSSTLIRLLAPLRRQRARGAHRRVPRRARRLARGRRARAPQPLPRHRGGRGALRARVPPRLRRAVRALGRRVGGASSRMARSSGRRRGGTCATSSAGPASPRSRRASTCGPRGATASRCGSSSRWASRARSRRSRRAKPRPAGWRVCATRARERLCAAALAGEYRRFLARFAGVADALARHAGPTPAQAFAIRTLLVHAYRRVRLRDPQLPRAVLADDWPGADAYGSARTIHRGMRDGAEAHLAATVEARRRDAGADRDRVRAPVRRADLVEVAGSSYGRGRGRPTDRAAAARRRSRASESGDAVMDNPHRDRARSCTRPLGARSAAAATRSSTASTASGATSWRGCSGVPIPILLLVYFLRGCN